MKTKAPLRPSHRLALHKKLPLEVFYSALLCFVLLSASRAMAQKSECIRFQNDSISILLAKARQENKLIFIDAYTEWCGPCKWMAANVFTNDTVAKFYNANFINVKMDMEKGEGPDIAKRYGIGCYPTYFFIDGTGALIHRQSGSCRTEAFINLGVTAMIPEKQFGTLEKKYESGTATSLELIRYMEMRQATCLSVDKQIKDYENTQAESDFANRKNWAILCKFIKNIDSKMFQYLLLHREVYDASYTADSVNQVITRICGTALSEFLRNQKPDTAGYKKLRKEIVAFNQGALDKVIVGGDMSFYSVIKDWNNYAKSTILFIDKYAEKNDFMTLNNSAWFFYEHVDDKAYLDMALAWAKKSVELMPYGFNTDTYAALLYKTGNFPEAIVQAKIAIELEKKEGEDFSETEKLLQKIETAEKHK